ncbi:Putative secreted protein (modular protein) [Candidatus Sulfotelmatomonas gaucii]|uniref:Secreted protein (Modular protein) n=1 Tax=Candidatus Sulfuritelmatomonas gaucii TaxID=2043161 RepID=A0A2N9L590_9BACT|nr:Putative secreted protein (modular protein) [Candidatus Sulfotelmatomonas gaucii]
MKPQALSLSCHCCPGYDTLVCALSLIFCMSMRIIPFPTRRAIWLAVLSLAIALAGGRPLCSQAQPLVVANTALSSPAGRWKTIDDKTGKVKSIVTIRKMNGELDGTIETLFNPPVPHPTCYLCSGAMKDRPLVGLQILWGLKKNGSQWSGGQVLDPETGKIYRASLALEDGGKKLRLHGYIGIPLLGRTQYWSRAE